MSEDWEKLAGEGGKELPTGRFKRALRMGSLGARVTASSLASKVGSVLKGGSAESKEEYLRQAYIKNAGRAVEALGQLKGASMKIGQLLSADPEMLPPEFADVLSSLQRDAPPMTYVKVRDQIEGALDRPMDAVFSFFDPESLGAASIGQVHRARLTTGEEVAVKVQYPGVAQSLESDLKTLRSLLVYGRAVIEKERLDTYLEEIRTTLMEESDYTLEAANLMRFQEILADRPGVSLPRVFEEWTRPTVLVMEYKEGQKLDEALDAMGPGERRDAILERWVRLYSWMFHECFEMHADPHPGNFLLGPDDELIMLDFGCVKRFEPAFADGLLDVLDACWQDEPWRATHGFMRLGFGSGKLRADQVDDEAMRRYCEILLAPFLKDEPFEFKGWSPAMESKMFMLRNPSLLRLSPPPEAIPFFRVLSGIKGLLGKLDAKINMYEVAVETARQRGRLTAEPLVSRRRDD